MKSARSMIKALRVDGMDQADCVGSPSFFCISCVCIIIAGCRLCAFCVKAILAVLWLLLRVLLVTLGIMLNFRVGLRTIKSQLLRLFHELVLLLLPWILRILQNLSTLYFGNRGTTVD